MAFSQKIRKLTMNNAMNDLIIHEESITFGTFEKIEI